MVSEFSHKPNRYGHEKTQTEVFFLCTSCGGFCNYHNMHHSKITKRPKTE